MQRKQRAAFTLLEVAISLFLVGILLTCLFQFFVQSAKLKAKTHALKEKVLKLDLFEMRLHQLFDDFSYEKNGFTASIPHPDAIGPALCFYAENGVDPDPLFSGPLHHMLFLTRAHCVGLCTWSKNNTPKVAILLNDVKELSFAFFSGTQWEAHWPKSKEEAPFPPMLKISVLMQGEGREYFFSLPENGEISYEKNAL